MSESENVKRCLNQAAEMASARIQVQDDDIRQLSYQLSQERQVTAALKEDICTMEEQVESQQKKAETSLLFMFLFGCLMAVSIAYSILNCQ